jgi:hypothetical protein
MSRGQGRVFRPKVKGKTCARWWLDYTTGGERHREPTKTTVKKDAQTMLRQRMGDRETGKVVGRPDRVTLAPGRAPSTPSRTSKGCSVPQRPRRS